MTLKDAVGIEIYFITENDAAETQSGVNNLSIIVKNDLNSIAYDKIEAINYKNLAQENTLLTYADK